MWPTLIFDKSCLQSLNADEAMWLDQFFSTNITPLFYIETLADLEKGVGKGKTPEELVWMLAYKTPDMNTSVNTHHLSLLEWELIGRWEVDIKTWRPILPGGKAVQLNWKTGFIFDKWPEEEAFSRWQKHDFLNLERLQAKRWRRSLSNINLEETYEFFKTFFPITKPKNLESVKRLVDFHMNDSDQGAIFRFGMTLVNVPEASQEKIIKRWIVAGKPKIQDFSPYFFYVFSVDFFFYLAISADLIWRGRASHKVDLAYLYYLPFCNVFSSSDNLHANIVPFFLRPDQMYIPGEDLKRDLKKLDSHFAALPDEVKEQGVASFAMFPPNDMSFLVSQLWNKYMGQGWKDPANQGPFVETDLSRKILASIKDFTDNSQPVENDENLTTDNVEHVLVKRSAMIKKGKWTRFWPDIVNAGKTIKNEE